MSVLKVAAAVVNLPVSQEPEAPLRVSAIVVQAEVKVAFVCCDGMIVPRRINDAAARRLAEQCGLAEENLIAWGSHTHHGPCTIDSFCSTPDAAYLQAMEDGIVQTVLEANAQIEAGGNPNLVEAEFLFAESQEATVGRNSRVLLKDGEIGWWGYQKDDVVRPTGPFDPDIPVLAFRRPTGEYAAIIYNRACHNIGAYTQGRLSPGTYGLVAQEIERRHGAVTLFQPGAFGSSHNVTYTGSGVPTEEAVTRLVAAIEDGLHRLRPALFGPLQVVRKPFTYHVRTFDEPTEEEKVRRYSDKYYPEASESHKTVFRAMRAEMADHVGEERETTVTACRLGEIALIGVPFELFARLGMEIRRRSPFRHTYIAGIVGDDVGYLGDREGYELGGYQLWAGWHSPCTPGDGEALVEQAVAMLEQLHDDRPCLEEPILRELRSDEAGALQRFYNTLSQGVRTRFRPMGWDVALDTCETIAGHTGQGERYDIVLDNGREIVGWAFLTRLDQPVANLGIGIADDYCGRGLGKRLMQALVDEAKRLGKAGIDLTVLQENERARGLYEKFGFAVTGTGRAADETDYYKMERRV
jgi:neutral ceramidase